MDRQQPITLSPEQLSEIQRIELECLVEFDRICRLHSIKYSADGGTLLGAVRHEGFIPWDDDIDVMMPRNEYERFFEVCKTELDKSRFFLSEHRTDKEYRVGFPRLKRLNTMYVRIGREDNKQVEGVTIDIFPLDNMPNNMILRYVYILLSFVFRKILWSGKGKRVKKGLIKLVYCGLNFIPAKVAFGGFAMLRKMCNSADVECISHYPIPNPKRMKFGVKKQYFCNLVDLQFENIKVRSVAEYDEHLRLIFGNYLELPPEEKRKPKVDLAYFRDIEE
ncbi:MAG: LicD family protein [Prevotellaceae bacterium]|nr:LicD family protein [Prevotellaceae bacterium]